MMDNEQIISMLQIVAELAFNCGFAALAWHVITKQIPAMQDDQKKDLDALRKAVNSLENMLIRVYEKVKEGHDE